MCFLVNIIRILVIKLRTAHSNEPSQYRYCQFLLFISIHRNNWTQICYLYIKQESSSCNSGTGPTFWAPFHLDHLQTAEPWMRMDGAVSLFQRSTGRTAGIAGGHYILLRQRRGESCSLPVQCIHYYSN